MSVILDPSRDGLKVFYGGKLRNLTGEAEKCIDWVIEVYCEILDDGFSYSVYDDIAPNNKFNYKGKIWEQLSDMYLDTNGIGRVYSDILDEIGIKFVKLDIKRVKL